MLDELDFHARASAEPEPVPAGRGHHNLRARAELLLERSDVLTSPLLPGLEIRLADVFEE